MIKTILLLSPIWLAGCSILQPKPPEVITVKVPVQVKCLGEVPEKPNLITDAQLVALDAPSFINAIHIDRLTRDIYEAKLEAVVEGCR